MIFVTVGAQLPFNRLVKNVDEWARKRGRNDIFAQIGNTDWRPLHIKFVKSLSPEEFKIKIKNADLIIGHAGMGTIISALELGKSVLVMPRKAALQETRNDHQVATAKRFLEMKLISVAFNENELRDKLDHINELKSLARIGTGASLKLIKTIQDFIND